MGTQNKKAQLSSSNGSGADHEIKELSCLTGPLLERCACKRESGDMDAAWSSSTKANQCSLLGTRKVSGGDPCCMDTWMTLPWMRLL